MVEAHREKVHLINPMSNVLAGSEQRTLELSRRLASRAEVQIWSEYFPLEPQFVATHGIRGIRTKTLRFPRDGVFVFVGAYFHVGNWLRFARPKRVIVLFNTPDYSLLNIFLTRLLHYKVKCPIDLAYAAHWLKDTVGLPGTVLASPVNLEKFRVERRRSDRRKTFTVGRLSRDVLEKHHPEDIQLYRQLASKGIRVRVMGGTVLAPQLRDVEGVELLEAGAEDAVDFLGSLDCFFYRTAPEWIEPTGRVVIEAMGCGLPVVCGDAGGYAEFIRHGTNGYLIAQTGQALQIIEQLARESELSISVGRAARDSVEAMYSAENMDRQLTYLTSVVPVIDISPHIRVPGVLDCLGATVSMPKLVT